MAYTVSDRGRVGQSTYWAYFGGFIVLTVILIAVAIDAVINFSFGTAIVCALLVLPLGIYFRVIMMRRCRDIGWPASLPWVFVGAGIVVNMFARASLTGGAMPTSGAMFLPLIVNLADFVFSIVIGCFPTKDSQVPYGEIFGPDDYVPGPAQRMPASRPGGGQWQQRTEPAAAHMVDRGAPSPAMMATDEPDTDRYDAAIARALEAHRSKVTEQQSSQPSSRPMPTTPLRAGGFGRKGL